jgi:hypothetical protein
LDTIVLYQNELSGLVHSTIRNLTNLRILTLFSNAIGGNTRIEINSLKNLKKIQLADNNFIGHLPDNICVGGMLQQFSARNNTSLEALFRRV